MVLCLIGYACGLFMFLVYCEGQMRKNEEEDDDQPIG